MSYFSGYLLFNVKANYVRIRLTEYFKGGTQKKDNPSKIISTLRRMTTHMRSTHLRSDYNLLLIVKIIKMKNQISQEMTTKCIQKKHTHFIFENKLTD